MHIITTGYHKYVFIIFCMNLKHMKFVSIFALLATTSGCMSGTMIKDVNIGSRGNGSIIQAAKNGNISTIRLVEYGTEFKHGGLTQQSCTYVYGD